MFYSREREREGRLWGGGYAPRRGDGAGVGDGAIDGWWRDYNVLRVLNVSPISEALGKTPRGEYAPTSIELTLSSHTHIQIHTHKQSIYIYVNMIKSIHMIKCDMIKSIQQVLAHIHP